VTARPSSRPARLPLGWTEADRAESDVLVWELVTLAPEHRARCPLCEDGRRTGLPCPRVGEAIEAVLDWHRRRRLLSRAEWHRRRRLLGSLGELRRREAS
jgi:hypothetical protein